MKEILFMHSGIFIPLFLIAAGLSFIVAPAFADDMASQAELAEDLDETSIDQAENVSSTTVQNIDAETPAAAGSVAATSSSSTPPAIDPALAEDVQTGSSTPSETGTSTAAEITASPATATSVDMETPEDDVTGYDDEYYQDYWYSDTERFGRHGHYLWYPDENRTIVDKSIVPKDTDECIGNHGWENFGFYSIGQCIKYVRTGIDSR